MSEANRRNLRDALLSSTVALPAAAATANHSSFDIGDGPHRERMSVIVECPATASLVDAKDIYFELEHSTDDSTFTDVGDVLETSGSAATVEGSIIATVTGDGGDGAPAVVFELPIPQNANRYIRVSQSVEAAGGDNTGVSATVYLNS